METPGLDHIALTVTDVARSSHFYGEVLGFELHWFPTDYPNKIFAGTFFFVVGGVEIGCIVHPGTAQGDRFDERRVGLDHLSFRAPSEAALHGLVDRLRTVGVPNNGVESYQPSHKMYVSFRDPDNLQLEYWFNAD